jgi:hypothetical protein
MLPEWFRLRQEPIVGLFVTTGVLSPAAHRSARENVVYVFEGEQVAEDLAASSLRAVWIDSACTFDQDRFVASFPVA